MVLNKRNLVGRSLFVVTCLTVGCTGSGMAGCGSSGTPEAEVETQLLGVYEVSEYRFTEEGCDGELSDGDIPDYFVVYPADAIDDAVLLGQFCFGIENCQQTAEQKPPNVNYSFFVGNDQNGWDGWGVVSQGAVGEMCQFDIQAHEMTSPSDDVIRIDTRQVETLFEATIDTETNEATCNARDGIASIREDSPCQALFELVGSRAAGL
ncbi:MAG: hypothetical protein AAF997_13325 [Myxococcota bacterium]